MFLFPQDLRAICWGIFAIRTCTVSRIIFLFGNIPGYPRSTSDTKRYMPCETYPRLSPPTDDSVDWRPETCPRGSSRYRKGLSQFYSNYRVYLRQRSDAELGR